MHTRIKKVAVFSLNKETNKIKKVLKREGFTLTTKNPDMVISLGGDGTYLSCERKFPCIPKILIKESKVCKKCNKETLKSIIKEIKHDHISFKKEPKLEMQKGKKKLIAINEISIRNKDPKTAIRFKIKINKKKISDEFIGDGVVIATPFGSTGYFYSITKKTFKKGIGIAFNNITVKKQPIIAKAHAEIAITVTRGTATLSADNNPFTLSVKENQTIKIKQQKNTAAIIKLNHICR